MGGPASPVRRQVVVRGRVQGVGFRWSCAHEAEQLGVSGWVRNRVDGSVEVVAEGPADAVDRLVDWCRTGPTGAIVRGLEIDEQALRGETWFRIVPT